MLPKRAGSSRQHYRASTFSGTKRLLQKEESGVDGVGRRKGPPRKDKAVCPAALDVLSHILFLMGEGGREICILPMGSANTSLCDPDANASTAHFPRSLRSSINTTEQSQSQRCWQGSASIPGSVQHWKRPWRPNQ